MHSAAYRRVYDPVCSSNMDWFMNEIDLQLLTEQSERVHRWLRDEFG